MNAIETQSLTRMFGERMAVDQLTLSIPTGTVFGFLGPNGAGKTTTVRMLAALIAPTHGTASIAGHQLGKDNDAIRRTIGILTETPGMYDKLSAWQNLMFFARLYDLDDQQAAAQVQNYLQLLDLWERRDDRVGGFSKGMRQKLAIARALLHEPQVVFLDEPTSGLDPEAARLVLDFVSLLRKEGRTIVLTTHNLAEADELCDLVGVFRTRMLRIGTPEELRDSLFGRGVQVRLASSAPAFENAVRALPFVKDVTAQNGALTVRLDNPDEQSPIILQTLMAAGAAVRSIEPVEHSLEEVYLQLVGSNRKEGVLQ